MSALLLLLSKELSVKTAQVRLQQSMQCPNMLCFHTSHVCAGTQGKPSSKSPKKRRFFQLSHDGSILRWSWNKYVVMYYVEVRLHPFLLYAVQLDPYVVI